MAEKLKAPWKRGGKRPDPALAAAREAVRLEQEQGGGSLGFTVKMMLIGLTGVDTRCGYLACFLSHRQNIEMRRKARTLNT